MRADTSVPRIRAAAKVDAASLCAIYNHYVTGTVITFEETPLDAAEMRRRVRDATLPWLVAIEDGEVAGYARASPWKSRASYRHTVEASVYVDPGRQRRGHGRRLYEALIAQLRGRGVHCVIGGIALPNPASVALHEALGFEAAGVLREVGRKFDRWIDVGYWVLVL
jgi:L-amino acid N-acyltransferase YncA